MPCDGDGTRETEMENRKESEDGLLTSQVCVDTGFPDSICRYSQLTQRKQNTLERFGNVMGMIHKKEEGFVERFGRFNRESNFQC